MRDWRSEVGGQKATTKHTKKKATADRKMWGQKNGRKTEGKDALLPPYFSLRVSTNYNPALWCS